MKLRMQHLCRLRYSLLVLLIAGPGLLAAQVSKRHQPVETFEQFFNIFETQYASFPRKGVDWKGDYSRYRSRVNANTTEQELWDLFCEMLTPLNDGHVKLRDADGNRFTARRPTPVMDEFSTRTDRKRFFPMVDSSLKKMGFGPMRGIGPKFRGTALFSYCDNGKVGYIRMTRSFSRLIKMQGLRTGAHLDRILAEFKDLEGLIFDIRWNVGGTDGFSRDVVCRMADQEREAYRKQTRTGAYSEFGKVEVHQVRPKGKAPWNKPVTLLTNGRTVSAADVFAIMMADLPHVTIIGAPTQGSFSDLVSKKLNNGWKVSLSDERYLSAEGRDYEGEGVPPDIIVHNRRADLETMQDPVLKTALQYLSKK